MQTPGSTVPLMRRSNSLHEPVGFVSDRPPAPTRRRSVAQNSPASTPAPFSDGRQGARSAAVLCRSQLGSEQAGEPQRAAAHRLPLAATAARRRHLCPANPPPPTLPAAAGHVARPAESLRGQCTPLLGRLLRVSKLAAGHTGARGKARRPAPVSPGRFVLCPVQCSTSCFTLY